MRITGIGPNPGMMRPIVPEVEKSEGSGFGDMVKGAIREVNNLQSNADTMAQKLAVGDVQDVHQVMLALEKASTAFGLTVQVRNKVVEAYQEIMRMQV